MSRADWSHPYQTLPEQTFWQSVTPTPLENPRWVDWNDSLADRLGISGLDQRPEALSAFAAGPPLSDWAPLAQVYSGHQFGQWAGQLGDGRGLYLGVSTHQGRSHEWHLKGAGLTPYSRMGDGRAVLRSSIREHLGSEYMHALGIPSTRSLALVASDTPVRRETLETGACLCRIAKSHLRIGHFEHFYYRDEIEHLRTMLVFAMAQLDPDLAPHESSALEFFTRVLERSARLVAGWMAVGFVHGVMNTDNTALSGETLDYGPYGFISHWDPEFVINHTDHSGRYAYGQQPSVMFWNCARLAETLTPFVSIEELKVCLESFPERYRAAYTDEMAKRTGVAPDHPELDSWVTDLQALFSRPGTYYPEAFFWLLNAQPEGLSAPHLLAEGQTLFQRWESMCERDRLPLARSITPSWMLSHWLLDRVIQDAQQGNAGPVSRLRIDIQSGLSEPSEAATHWGSHPPQAGQTFHLSCSS